MLNYKNYGRLWRVYGTSVLKYGSPKKFLNAARTELAYRRRQVDVKTYPYMMFLEPLYYCNLDCPLCPRQNFPNARKGRQAGRLSMETYDRVLDEIGDYLFQLQIFGNGEPLLDYARTHEIVEKAHQKRIFTLVNTNATLLTEAVAEQMVGSGLDYAICAIDGVTQGTYEKYRVGGKVEEALNGLRRLVKERDRQNNKSLQIEWQFLVHRYTVGEMATAKSMAADMGVYLRFAPMGGMENNPAARKYWLPERAEASVAGLDDGYFAGVPGRDFACYWLWRSCFLNSNGTMGRCPGYANIAELGSVNDDSLLNVYNQGSQAARRLFRPEPYPAELGDGPMPCNTCVFYNRHHGADGGKSLPGTDSEFGAPSQMSADAIRANAGLVPLGLPRRSREMQESGSSHG